MTLLPLCNQPENISEETRKIYQNEDCGGSSNVLAKYEEMVVHAEFGIVFSVYCLLFLDFYLLILTLNLIYE